MGANSRMLGANEQIDVYLGIFQENGRLSKEQKSHIKEIMCVCDKNFYKLANELLNSK